MGARGPYRSFVEGTGELTSFALRFFRNAFHARFEWSELLRQCLLNGYRSLPLVAVTGFIMGLVLTVQSRPTLARFGAEAMLPAMVAISVVREIAPVITALICAGKVGSSLGAELGKMEMKAALTGLAKRFPDLALADAPDDVAFRELSIVYGVDTLPVRLW